MPTFDFDRETVSNGFVDVDDISNFAIKATTSELLDYYLIIRTSMGIASIYTYGPIQPDLKFFQEPVFASFKKIDFNQRQIEKIINTFLNEGYKKIKYAEEVDIMTALESCKDLTEYMKGEER